MRTISAIGLNTLRELVRGRALILVLLFMALLVLISTFFGAVTIGDQAKVILNFGLFGVSFGAVLFVSIAGTTMLQRELERRTVYNILGKAVPRYQFLLGKFFGLLATTTIIAALMSFALVLYLFLLTGQANTLVFAAVGFFFCELAILCAASIFFSALVVTPILGGCFTFATFLVGRSAAWILTMADADGMSRSLSKVLHGVYYLIPHLQQMVVADGVVYGIMPSGAHLLWSFVYAAGYAGALLVVGSAVFKHRDFN